MRAEFTVIAAGDNFEMLRAFGCFLRLNVDGWVKRGPPMVKASEHVFGRRRADCHLELNRL